MTQASLSSCKHWRWPWLLRSFSSRAWVTAALAGAHLAVRGPRLRWGWWLFSAASAALGFLTKGPVALLLVTVPVLALGFLDARVVRPRLRGWSVYLGVAAGLALPWYAALAAADPDFLGYFF